MDETKLKQFKELLALTTGSLTKEEFLSFSQKVLEYVKTIKSTTETDLQTISQAVKTAISRIESTASDNYAKTEEKLTKEQENALNKMYLEVESMLSMCDKKMEDMKDGDDGIDADEEAVIAEVLARLPEPKEETPETVRDLLETLEGEDRLKIDAIDKLREELDRLEKEIKSKNTTVMGGARGVGVLDEGQTVALSAQWLNFTGAGVSVSNVGNQTVIQITGGGVGSTTPTQESGAIADLTTIVTLAHTPYTDTLMLYINEAFVDPSRYSVNGSNEIVMGSPLDASYTGLRYTAIYQYA